MLTQSQIADAEAYVVSLSNVKWPTLALNGSNLTGSNFVPNTSIQLYSNGTAMGSTINTDSAGNLSTTFTPPAGQSGTISANYAVLNEPGIYPNGDSSQGDVALDGTRTASYTVATVSYTGAAPAPVPSAPPQPVRVLPETGSDASPLLILAGTVLTLLGAVLLSRQRGWGIQ